MSNDDHDHDTERLVHDALARLGAGYEAMPCDPDLADTAAFCAHYGVALDDSANAIVVVGKTEPRIYVCCLVLATTRLDVNGAVRRRLGVKKASFASADETRELTGMMIGGVTPFGLPDGMALWVDSRVVDRPSVIVGGGSRSLKIRVDPAVFTTMPATEVVTDLALPV
jgi:prolyl-tRNA editing enzyme YbaK/EbsC (Cys-tRNA(Pro) deacylase)